MARSSWRTPDPDRPEIDRIGYGGRVVYWEVGEEETRLIDIKESALVAVEP